MSFIKFLKPTLPKLLISLILGFLFIPFIGTDLGVMREMGPAVVENSVSYKCSPANLGTALQYVLTLLPNTTSPYACWGDIFWSILAGGLIVIYGLVSVLALVEWRTILAPKKSKLIVFIILTLLTLALFNVRECIDRYSCSSFAIFLRSFKSLFLGILLSPILIFLSLPFRNIGPSPLNLPLQNADIIYIAPLIVWLYVLVGLVYYLLSKMMNRPTN